MIKLYAVRISENSGTMESRKNPFMSKVWRSGIMFKCGVNEVRTSSKKASNVRQFILPSLALIRLKTWSTASWVCLNVEWIIDNSDPKNYRTKRILFRTGQIGRNIIFLRMERFRGDVCVVMRTQREGRKSLLRSQLQSPQASYKRRQRTCSCSLVKYCQV